MRAWIAPLVTCLLAPSIGCQRLPDEEDDDGSDPSAPTDDGSAGTLIPPDDGNDPDADGESGGSSNACDPVDQVGCPMDQKCTAILSAGQVTYACVSDGGGLGPYDPCVASYEDGIDSCPAGAVCLADEGDNGLCAPLCETNGDCDQGECLPARVSQIPYCADDCSPFDSQCPAPLACRRNGDRFSCQFLGLDDVGGVGAGCAVTNDAGCAPGLVCVPGALVPDCSTDNCCTTLCDVTEPGSCASPSSCNPILPGPAPGFEEIGACFVPA